LSFYRTEATKYIVETEKTRQSDSTEPVAEAITAGSNRMDIDDEIIEAYIESWDNIDQHQIIRDYQVSQRGRICKAALLGGLKGAVIGAGIGGVFDLINFTIHHAQTPPPSSDQGLLTPSQAGDQAFDRVITAHNNDYGVQYNYINEYTPTHIHPTPFEASHGLTQSTDYGDALRYAVQQGVKSGQLHIPSALQNHNLIHELHFAGGPDLPLGAEYHFDSTFLQGYIDRLAENSLDSTSYYDTIRHAAANIEDIHQNIKGSIYAEALNAGNNAYNLQTERLAALAATSAHSATSEVAGQAITGGVIGALGTVAGEEAASSPLTRSGKDSAISSGAIRPETRLPSEVKPPLTAEAKRTAQAEEARRKEIARRYQALKAIASARLEDKNFEANDSPETRRKLAWFDVYSRLDVTKPDDQMLHDRADRIRQQWATADDVSGDYPQDDPRFRHQTGQAMLEIIAGDENFHLSYAEAAGEMSDNRERTRAFAHFVLNYISSYDELAGEGDEADNKFKRIAREAINKKGLAVHSAGPAGSDLDGETAIHLFNLIPQEAGMPNIVSEAKYIPTGEHEKDRINIDTGNRDGFVIEDGVIYLDHHTPGTQKVSSATEMTYLFLRELGLIEDQPWIRSMVRFVTDVDSGNIDHNKLKLMFESDNPTYPRSLLALSHTANFSQLCEYFKDNQDATILDILTEDEVTQYFEEAGTRQSQSMARSVKKGEQVFGELEKRGFVVDTKYGKALIDVRLDALNPPNGDTRWPTELGYIGAAAHDCPVYVIWSPGSSYFVSINLPDKDEPINFDLGADCLNVRGHLFMKRKDQRLQTTLADILDELGVEGRPSAELRKVIDYQPKPRSETPQSDKKDKTKKKDSKKPQTQRSQDGP